MTFWKWSQTPASNATADSTINWAEGQAPSSVNDSARAMMAAAAKYRDDISGKTATGGGTTAYTFSSNQNLTTLTDGYQVAFTCNATNTGAATLNVDGRGAIPLQKVKGTDLAAGELVAGCVYTASYDADATAAWVIHGGRNQTYDAELNAIAGLTSAADRVPYFTGPGTAALAVLTAFGRSIAALADAAAARDLFGLGTSATVNTGTSGATIPLLNGDNTHSGANTFSNAAGVTAVNTAKAKGTITWSGGTPTLQSGSFGIASITDQNEGDTIIHWSTAFPNANYVCVSTAISSGQLRTVTILSQDAGSVRIVTRDAAGSPADPARLNVLAF